MKILNSSLLLFKINPNKDTVKCWHIFWISGLTFKMEKQTFNLNEIPFRIVVEFYNGLSNDYQKKYKL